MNTTNSTTITPLKKLLRASADFASHDAWFEAIATHLMNRCALRVGISCFRITECEVYYHAPGHEDPYVHGAIYKDSGQQTIGHLYLNKAGGLDLTFGHAPAYGGVLIRGIRNLETNEYTNQITGVVKELFRALGDITVGASCLELVEGGVYKKLDVARSQRVGLKHRQEDQQDYLHRPYRFIVELNQQHKFKNREQVVRELWAQGKVEEAKDILGYTLKN